MRLLAIFFQRLLYGIILLLAVLILNFVLIHLAPGDPVEAIAGEMGGATEAVMAKIRAAYGLDKSMPEQLILYLRKVATGDFGYSYFFNTPVLDLILERIPATMLLVITALIMAILVGTFLGVFSSRKPNGALSHFVTILALAGYSVPVFWTGLMLLILFTSVVSVFPVAGMATVYIEGGAFAKILDVLHHLVLPTATLSIIYVAVYSRLTRANMLDVLGSDYIRTARAKGLSERAVFYQHALKNAVLPVVTYAGLQFSQLFAGAVLVETVFNWPGLGRLAYESILRRDHPTMLGLLFFSALIVIVINILTDLSYRLIDPRIGAKKK